MAVRKTKEAVAKVKNEVLHIVAPLREFPVRLLKLAAK